MPEHELWLTALFNNYLAAPASALLSLLHITVENPARPWPNWLVMEILVVAILMALVAFTRGSFSVTAPGKVQHLFELLYGFLNDTAEDIGLHHPRKYVPFFGTLFIFILIMNLIGIIPTLESPTTTPAVPAGLAVCAFLYYNYLGVREHGILKYLAHFAGPVWWLAFLMIPIEIISHIARPLSLTIRLYGNIFAGDQVTDVFIRLTRLIVPVLFMALHVFVAVVQAYVFTLLTVIYVNGATSHDAEHEQEQVA
jgi:F-type H+-transporting ATPase subunit a